MEEPTVQIVITRSTDGWKLTTFTREKVKEVYETDNYAFMQVKLKEYLAELSPA